MRTDSSVEHSTRKIQVSSLAGPRRAVDLDSQNGFTLVEALVVSGLMLMILFATSSMMINQYRETESLSQKLSVLDLEKLLILNSSANDICANQMSTSPVNYTFPTASFPPPAQQPVALSSLYMSAGSPQLLAAVNQSLTGSGDFKISSIQLTDFAGSPGNYMAKLDISFVGSIRPIKNLKL